MTIKEKATKSDLPVETVASIAEAAGIDAEDVERTLTQPKAIKPGTAVKNHQSGESDKEEPKVREEQKKEVRFWTIAIRHLIGLDDGKKIKFEDHALVLDAEEDKKEIAVVRSLQNIIGRYEIYEVVNEPLGEDSKEFYAFQELLERLVYTGQHGERSKSGIKAVRAMFSHEELVGMKEYGFDPRRIIQKTLRTKSLKPISN